jgi:outer membrane protein OmpA-like peptidoglycan-associated protein
VVSTTMPVVITFPPTTAQTTTTTTVVDTTVAPTTTAWVQPPGVPVRSATYVGGVFAVAGAVPDQQTADALVAAYSGAAGTGNVQSSLLVAAGAPLVDEEPLLAPEAIPFAPNSAALPASSAGFLDTLARLLLQNPTLEIDIRAYTNGVGPAESNLVLSQQRADMIYLYLLASGVAAERMTATGYGEGVPIADDATEDGRNRNRRVEFTLRDLLG